MDNNSEEQLLEEVRSVIDAEGLVVEIETEQDFREHFSMIEKALYDEYSFEGPAYIFIETLVASTPEEVARLDTDYPDSRKLMGQESEVHGATRIELGAQGDLWELLNSKISSFALANDDNVKAMYARCPIIVGEGDNFDTPLSEQENKQDGVITAMVSNETVRFLIRRDSDPDDIIEQVINPKEYKMGDMRLVDALIYFWFFPRWIQHDSPELFKSMLEDLEEKYRKQQEEE